MTSPIIIIVNSDPLIERLSALGQRQAPYAIMKGLNAIALDAQDAMRKKIHRTYTVRRATFIDRLVKIEQFARKTSLKTRFGIAGPNADLLTKFEEGGPKPTRGPTTALPVEARRGRKSGIISKGQRPRALLDARKEKRVFVVTGKSGNRLLLQRTGRKKSSRTRVLYAFTPSARVHIPASLEFFKTVAGVIRGRSLMHFREGFAQAMATAR